MSRYVREHRDAGMATTIALVMVLIYSLWGASMLHNSKATLSVAAAEQHSLAVK